MDTLLRELLHGARSLLRSPGFTTVATLTPALGIGAALTLTRVLAALLFDVSPTDPATFVIVACLLAPVAVVPSYLPARRAARVDPLVALRVE